MCFLFLGALTFFTETKLYALISHRIGAILMKKSDEETDGQPCSSSEIREDVEEISIRVESSCEGKNNLDGFIFGQLFLSKIERLEQTYLQFRESCHEFTVKP